jgi:hypothetical protein
MFPFTPRQAFRRIEGSQPLQRKREFSPSIDIRELTKFYL